MDPNTALKELREIAKKFVECPENAALPDELKESLMGNHDGCSCAADMERAGELIEGLDQWLSKGGFLPKDWERRP